MIELRIVCQKKLFQWGNNFDLYFFFSYGVTISKGVYFSVQVFKIIGGLIDHCRRTTRVISLSTQPWGQEKGKIYR